ncbi:MAG: hypothetical protein JNM31_07415 [Flavobacteriales bacterium]|nr:hypothetical protein [Flavobacteriales bacterium]
MSKTIALIALLFLPVAMLHAQTQPKVRYNTKHQEVIFTPDMSKESLEVLRKDLLNHAITLHYVHTAFSPTSGLQSISFTVKDSSGRKFEASTDALPKDGFFGFEFGFADGKSKVLNVGTLHVDP